MVDTKSTQTQLNWADIAMTNHINILRQSAQNMFYLVFITKSNECSLNQSIYISFATIYCSTCLQNLNSSKISASFVLTDEIQPNLIKLGYKFEKSGSEDLTVWGPNTLPIEENTLKSIIKNYILIDQNTCSICSTVKSFNMNKWYFATINIDLITKQKPITQALPITIPDKFNPYGIISCGIQGTSTLPFYELLGVFSIHVWMAITLSILSLIWFTRHLSYSFMKIRVINPLQLILEQGDPFPKSFFKTLQGRLIFCFLGLASLVISSAYKNDNVCKTGFPRVPLGYELLEELNRDNFILYTKAGTIAVDLEHVKLPL